MQRSDILQAAAQIFRQKGYHAATMRDIADAVHLQKPSLYHHIDSKQDILLAILDKALDLLIEDLLQVVDSEIPTEDKLRQAMRVYTGRLAEDADLAAVLLLEYRNLEPELRTRHIARRDRYEALWRQLVREGIESGEFREVDEAITTFALLGVQNWMIIWYREGGRLSAKALAEQFCDLFLEGLAKNEEAEEG
ncbi:MAG: TetR family transcriptional regulator [Anaerolineales bacterium]|nr:TetR family transcriptional regulator [Anaerolineales bacterium]